VIAAKAHQRAIR